MIDSLTAEASRLQTENERLQALIASSDTMRTNSCKSIERLQQDLVAKDAEVAAGSRQAEDERAAADDWETDFNEERRQKVASQAREKKLTHRIRQANYRLEVWIKQPAWACEEYNDFTVAWETVMQLLEETK
jgi:septal ring factor EnvC (AmiA/AmiB activator)